MDVTPITVPCATTSFFDRILTIDWYDGFTSGAVLREWSQTAYRFDLITWGPGQDMRVFALSRIDISAFNEVVQLWSQLELPTWPVWHIPWRKMSEDLSKWNRELDSILANAAEPEFALETDSMFQTISAIRAISDSAPAIPKRFGPDSFLDNFAEWHRYLGASA